MISPLISDVAAIAYHKRGTTQHINCARTQASYHYVALCWNCIKPDVSPTIPTLSRIYDEPTPAHNGIRSLFARELCTLNELSSAPSGKIWMAPCGATTKPEPRVNPYSTKNTVLIRGWSRSGRVSEARIRTFPNTYFAYVRERNTYCIHDELSRCILSCSDPLLAAERQGQWCTLPVNGQSRSNTRPQCLP